MDARDIDARCDRIQEKNVYHLLTIPHVVLSLQRKVIGKALLEWARPANCGREILRGVETMMQKSAFLSLSAVFVAASALAGIPNSANAEPPACYADAPRVLPAPMEYGRAYRTADATIPYEQRPTYVSYRRAYSGPVVKTRRVVTTTPPVEYDDAVGYTETDYLPATEGYAYASPYYRSYGYVGARYYRPYRRYASYGYGHGHRSHYRPRPYLRHRSHRYYGNRSYGRRSYGHRSHGYRSYGHRSYRRGYGGYRSRGSSWGFGVGYARGPYGGSSGGFSFHYGR